MNPPLAAGRLSLVALVALCLASAPSLGQIRKRTARQGGPRVILAYPLGAVPGKTSRLTLRGLKLETATALRFMDSRVTAKIGAKGKTNLPDKVPLEKAGDSQIEADVTLAADVPAGTLSFVAVTPAGDSPPHSLLVERAIPAITEKEPNNGFRQAQKIQVPQIVDGVIQHRQDVDVFCLEGKAGQKLSLEVLAARHGSTLDSLLTLYDGRGQQLASNDDSGDSSDSRLEVTLPADGPYYVAIMDALDRGGPTYVYRLVVKIRK